jgi:acetoin utilization deacetylase AcuC-like enzyme
MVVRPAIRAIRRHWRRAINRISHPGVRFVYHKSYQHVASGVPLDPERAARIMAFLDEEGLLRPEDISVPRRCSLHNILRVHSEPYLDSLQQQALTRILGIPVREDQVEGVLDFMLVAVGGTVQATRLALRRSGVAVNLGGGFHHAEADRGLGFCVFNDIAVAIRRLRARQLADPILIIDLDLHDGNGTRAIFADDDTVYTYSIHNTHWGPTEAQASTAIALGANVGDELYLGTLLKSLPPVIDAVRPGLVVYLAGTDPASDDRIGNWSITENGLFQRDRFVIEQIRRRNRTTPIAIVLGGGYGTDTWRHSARFLAWLVSNRSIEPPGTEELTLRRFRRITAQLDRTQLTAEPSSGDFDWHLTNDDLSAIIPGNPRPTRFLGYFSRHGVELTLERFGILDQLRAKGFWPHLELDLERSTGQTVRIYSDPVERELLVEISVNRSRRAISSFEVMVIEWLLLQNPKEPFTPDRPRLPGQNHPGLGLLREFFGWLVMLCEILELDGIVFTPSRYNVAALSHKLVRFVEPEHEARFRAFEKLLADRPLATRTRLINQDKILDADTGRPARWDAQPMVLPVASQLEAAVFGSAYEEAVAARQASIQLKLAPPAQRPAWR